MLVLCTDRFGHELASSLASVHAVDVQPMQSFSEVLSAGPLQAARASTVIVAASRPWPSLFERIDGSIRSARRDAVFVFLEGSTLVVGPTLSAGRGCWQCFARRELMHLGADGPTDAEVARRQFMDMNPAYESFAWLPHVVELARAMALESLAPTKLRAGFVRKLGLLSGTVTEASVVSLHGCSCRTALAMPGTRVRFVDGLSTLLSGDLSHG
jgi:bacteriocin biosynthesis cyclodehydratase domain-containing protein